MDPHSIVVAVTKVLPEEECDVMDPFEEIIRAL